MTYDDDRACDRLVEFEEDVIILPDRGEDDTDSGWSVGATSNDVRLLEERPPHWD